MIGCRSRADVATWQSLLCSDPHCSKTHFQQLLFSLQYTCIQTKNRNQGSNHKNYIINIINIKKNVKMKDRREYSMSVLGTHHTPKLSFLLDLKQELTLNRTHTRHNATNTKTVLHMLKKIGDQFGLTHTAAVLLEVHKMHTDI